MASPTNKLLVLGAALSGLAALMHLACLVVGAPLFRLLGAGIRHLVMDVGVGHTLKGSNRASTIVLVVSGVLMVAGAVWIW